MRERKAAHERERRHRISLSEDAAVSSRQKQMRTELDAKLKAKIVHPRKAVEHHVVEHRSKILF